MTAPTVYMLLVVALAALGIVSLSFARLLLVRYELGQRGAAIQQEIGELQAEHARLQAQLAYWQSDEGLERLAREQLGWARPGETAVLLTGAAAGQTQSSGAPAAARPGDGAPNWKRWWQLLFGS